MKQTVQNFLNIEEVGNSGPYVNYREVFGRFQMSPGHYVIVPATFEPNSPGSFYIRVYSDTQTTLRYKLGTFYILFSNCEVYCR